MTISNAVIAQEVLDLINERKATNDELQAWIGGTVGGGDFLDGKYPLTDPVTLVERYTTCPAQLEDDVSGLTSSASSYAAAALVSADAAEVSRLATVAIELLTESDRADAVAAKVAAENAQSAAENAAVTALAQAALTSADAIATAADVVQTGLDAAATAADAVQTGLDAVATAADVVYIDSVLAFVPLTNVAETITGAWTFSGAFTSLGIDDNATGERLDITDTRTTITGILDVDAGANGYGQIDWVASSNLHYLNFYNGGTQVARIVQGNGALSFQVSGTNIAMSCLADTSVAFNYHMACEQTAKFWFDGQDQLGDTYITSPSANRFDIVAGGVAAVQATATGVTLTGTGTVTGNFTSLGIDDNATGERLQISDTTLTLGASGSDYYIAHLDSGQELRISAGGAGSGGELILSGEFHATNPGRVQFEYNNSATMSIVGATAATTFHGPATVQGAFTSLGIDDNASGERLEIADGSIRLGTAGADFEIRHQEVDRSLLIRGGDGNGGELLAYGASHLTLGGDLQLRSSANAFLVWDESAGSFVVSTGVGAKTLALTLDASQNATFSGDVTLSGGDLKVTSSGNQQLYLIATDANPTSILMDTTTGSAGRIRLENDGGSFKVVVQNSIDALTIDTSQNATFAGDVLIGTSPVSQEELTIVGADAGAGSAETILRIEQPATSIGSRAEIAVGVVSGTAPYMTFRTRDSSTPYSVVDVLTLNGDQSATFASNVTAQGATAVITADASGGFASLRASGSGTNSSYLQLYNDTYGEIGRITAQNSGNVLISSGGTTTALTLNASQNATFAGDVEVTNTFRSNGEAIVDNSLSAGIKVYRSGGTAANTGMTFNGLTSYMMVGIDSSESFAVKHASQDLGTSPLFKVTSAGDATFAGAGTFVGGVDKLTTATGAVSVAAAAAPSTGQVLTATGTTTATWQTAAGGGDLTAGPVRSTSGTSSIITGGVTQTHLAANSVGQSEVKTASEYKSTSSAWNATGGQYVLSSLYRAGNGGNGFIYQEELVSGNLSFLARWRYYSGGSGSYMGAYLYYIPASPPYDMGDGDIPLFLYADLDVNGKVIGFGHAPDPPWAYNGPTNVVPDVYRPDGSGYQLIHDESGMRVTRAMARAGGWEAKRDFALELKEQPLIEREVDHALKNADWDLYPSTVHIGPVADTSYNPDVVAHVLIDPVSPFVRDVADIVASGEDDDINNMIENYVNVSNSNLVRQGPAGLLIVGADWKRTTGNPNP